MNICMVLEKYFPRDIRVEKEARALINSGHEVYVLSLGRNGMPESDNFRGINVIHIFPRKSFLNRAWEYLWFVTFFIRPFWRERLEEVIKQYEIDIIHVHDLPLVKTAVSVAKKFGIPIIADLHENYPEAVKALKGSRKSLKSRIYNLLIPVWRWKRLEKTVLHRVDEVITVVDEAKKHYVNDCGLPPDKVTVVMNVVDLEEFERLGIDKTITEKYRDNFVISYIGGFGPHRGLDIAIKSMPRILREIPHAKLLLVGGKGPPEYETYLKKLCRDLKVERNVEFTGWVDFSLVPSYIAASNVCLIPHRPSGHTNTTIPHKLFQYMAMRKPVIVTDCKPLKTIVEECNCGIVVPPDDFNAMAEAIIKLYKDEDYARLLGENGRRMVEEKYNWKNEARKLLKVYEKYEK